ncbi:MAG: hypothetical protein EBX50_10445 [Chitinophagia bacterium]|nr:hypothetical protein [Chitinophagia bacterium]
MFKKHHYSLLLCFFIFLVSCKPYSKEAYLKQYSEFIETISRENDTYTDDDWVRKDKKFKQFNEDWYNEFETEFSFSEKITITKFKAKYSFYRYMP